MISSRIRLKVQSVKSVKDLEGRECFQIEFAEVRQRPPVMMVTNPEVPDEIGQMVVQVTKSFQNMMPGMGSKEYELAKLTLILTGDELESFKLRPYPNQLYELTISDGTLSFAEV
ncbi:hypothetical protein FJY84_04515 [Candidatus Bathyarchaeota archaeon]|nr:hypothetical protein [Candidatus Bathyarchaeota archaeon]